MNVPHKDQIVARIGPYIAKEILYRDEPVGADEDLFDAGFDSMSITRLIVFVEKEYGLVIESKDYTVDDVTTASTTADLVLRMLAQKGS